MKRPVFSLFLLCSAACSSPSTPELAPEAAPQPAPEARADPDARPSERAKPTIRRYGVESGIVRYELGGAQSGTEELYFTDYGLHEAKFTVGESAGADGAMLPLDKLVLIDGATQQIIDRRSNTGTTLPDMYALFGRRAKAKFMKSKVPPSQLMLAAMGGKATGTDVVAGIECEVWKVPRSMTEVCVKDGVILRSKIALGGVERTTTATVVEFGVEVPADKFALPEGVELGALGQAASSP